MKRFALFLALMPKVALAQIKIVDVVVAEPPSELELAMQDPTNWILLGILAVVVIVGLLLLNKKKG